MIIPTGRNCPNCGTYIGFADRCPRCGPQLLVPPFRINLRDPRGLAVLIGAIVVSVLLVVLAFMLVGR